MDRHAINEATRQVYHLQHTRVANDEVAMQRFLNMIQEAYFGLPEHYFQGKRVLDAGCGDTAKLLIRFSQFGATDLVGLDLGMDFIPVARASLERHGVPPEHVELVSGSVDALPFADEEFDFVCCHGVLLHLADFDQVKRAFSELARVTKRGGHLYTVYGLYGGLFEAVYPAIRAYYQENEEFRHFIDKIDPNDFTSIARYIASESRRHGNELGFDLEVLSNLLDVDLCVTLQNIIQAPVRLPISPEFVADQYALHGFSELRRLKRFVHRKNVRKVFAPLHYAHEHPLSRILYGSGNLEYIAQKR